MSELRLNVLDAGREIFGTAHTSVVDSALAGLSAEPETIEELQDAMARLIKPVDDDCPMCQAMAEEYAPTFCHLDG